MATGGSDESRSHEHIEGNGTVPSPSDGEPPSTGRHAAGARSAGVAAPAETAPVWTPPQPRSAALLPPTPALTTLVEPTVSAEDANALTQQMPRVGRRRPTATVVSIGIAAVVLLVAGATVLATKMTDRGTHGPATANTARGSGASGAGSPPHLTANIPLGDGGALLAKIVAAPRHAHLYRIDGSVGGVMNVTQYVAHYFAGARTELARLKNEGFRVGASTDFVRSDGLEVATHLAQFADADGALSYFLGEKSAWNSNDTVTGTFDVAGVTDGVGYEVATADALGNRRVAMYAHVGNIVVVINTYTGGRIDADVDARFLRAQVTALR